MRDFLEEYWKHCLAIGLGLLLLLSGLVWLVESSNPETPAGYIGYLTQGAMFGQTKYYGLQTGPTSPGKTWMLEVINVSITPFTYDEEFKEPESVLSKDNLKVSFRVHIIWKIRRESVKDFIDKYSTLINKDPDTVVSTGYKHFLKEPLRTYARDEVQKSTIYEIKDKIDSIGESIFAKVKTLTDGTPFEVISVVVGNIQYPPEIVDAVAKKIATTQLLEQKKTEIEIEKAEKEKRIVQAEGIAKSMEIIQVKLTNQYLQHEAIEAQKAMVGSPNHTTIYIPVGPMGVPLVGTLPSEKQDGTSKNESKK